MMKKVSPWTVFNNWLFDGNMKTELDEETIKAINPRSIMDSLCNMYQLTTFINDNFNNLYIIYYMDKSQFFSFIKSLIIKKKIGKYDLGRLKIKKNSAAEIKKIHSKLPHLKMYEIETLLKCIKGDEEEESFLDYLGVKENKKKKLTKKVKTLFEKTEVSDSSGNKVSFEEWKSNFSN